MFRKRPTLILLGLALTDLMLLASASTPGYFLGDGGDSTSLNETNHSSDASIIHDLKASGSEGSLAGLTRTIIALRTNNGHYVCARKHETAEGE
jgi:hypothetical protein